MIQLIPYQMIIFSKGKYSETEFYSTEEEKNKLIKKYLKMGFEEPK